MCALALAGTAIQAILIYYMYYYIAWLFLTSTKEYFTRNETPQYNAQQIPSTEKLHFLNLMRLLELQINIVFMYECKKIFDCCFVIYVQVPKAFTVI